jgi:hypothetical protein
MRRIAITLTAALALIGASGAAASAQPPASPQASCVAVITSFEATQLAPGSIGSEVSGLAASPGLGSALVSPLARAHLGSIAACQQAE